MIKKSDSIQPPLATASILRQAPGLDRRLTNSRSNNWTSLRLFNIYRLSLTTIFFSQSFVANSPLLNINHLGIYSWASFSYLIISLLSLLTCWIERRGYNYQVQIFVYTDTILIILLMHSCGGITSGLGMLLIVSIAATGLLGRSPQAVIFSSLATLGLLAEYLYSTINISSYSGSSTQVGILGATLFVTAIITQKLKTSEVLIQQKEMAFANLAALNGQILQNMQAGVIALDESGQVQHINNTALKMLQIIHKPPFSLKLYHPKILQLLESWRLASQQNLTYLPSETGIKNIQINFRRLESRAQKGTLIYLDDISTLKDEMQQARLASLGHLTANIAHEIRNPLSAISHAAQLLYENKELAESDSRLSEIIQHHSDRINNIIENVQSISRGSDAIVDRIKLADWFDHFIQEFCQSDNDLESIDFTISCPEAVIEFDSVHFNRILTNLCQNSRIHGDCTKPLHIHVTEQPENQINIEVADEGPGINEQELDKLFEPFYTTSFHGSGLGLYIVNQLCELNDASISVFNNDYQGSSFQLTIKAIKL